jgi:hypothetical protein
MLIIVLDASSSMRKLESIEREGPVPRLQQTTFAEGKGPMRIGVPTLVNRMSIERYLSAPFSDETATAPAIDSALRTQVPRDWIDSPTTLYHSRETSLDIHSDGLPNFSIYGRFETQTSSQHEVIRHCWPVEYRVEAV